MRFTPKDEDDEDAKPPCGFTVYFDEGTSHFKAGDHRKAFDCYTQALDIQPNDKLCLVARSKCLLRLGDPKAALADAETALKSDNLYVRAIYQKAEALYHLGDFERALMFYHRGNQVRNEIECFRLGVQKAQEAIENSIGHKSATRKVNLEKVGPLMAQEVAPPTGRRKAADVQVAPAEPPLEPRHSRRLLGPLFVDKEYLEQLVRHPGLQAVGTTSTKQVVDLAEEALTFLRSRQEFWRQHKPLYTRDREREGVEKEAARRDGEKRIAQKAEWEMKATRAQQEANKMLADVEKAIAEGRAKEAVAMTERALNFLNSRVGQLLPKRRDDEASVLHARGRALASLGNYDEAMLALQRQSAIADQCKLPKQKAKALDEMAKTHAAFHKFRRAIEAWENRLPLSVDSVERSWLYHEIGRCYLELEQADMALNYGTRALEEAAKADEASWGLNAAVLIAQSEVKMGHLPEARDAFLEAEKFASLSDNKAALEYLRQAEKAFSEIDLTNPSS